MKLETKRMVINIFASFAIYYFLGFLTFIFITFFDFLAFRQTSCTGSFCPTRDEIFALDKAIVRESISSGVFWKEQLYWPVKFLYQALAG